MNVNDPAMMPDITPGHLRKMIMMKMIVDITSIAPNGISELICAR